VLELCVLELCMTSQCSKFFAGFTCVLMTCVMQADSIEVTNMKSGDNPYWVAVFYTYTKDGKKILIPNQDGEWPDITSSDSKIAAKKTKDVQRPGLRFRDSSGSVKLWYDRDLIALNSHGYTEYMKQKKSLKKSMSDEIKLPTPSSSVGGAFSNDYGYWLNVGSTKNVNTAQITDNFGLIKIS